MSPPRKPSTDARKTILFWAALALVISGLFPPWLYTFDRTSTSDWAGARSERNAGYAFIFEPPEPDFYVNENGGVRVVSVPSNSDFKYYATCGIKLDVVRLLVEWSCILAVGGAAWGTARLSSGQRSEMNQKPQGGVV